MTARNGTAPPAAGTRLPAIQSTLEREIKLGVSSGFRWPKLPGRPLPPRVLTSTYYDTPDHRLARAQITLRHRIERRKSLWQLKLPLDNGRRELEIAAGPKGPPPALRDLLSAHLRGDKMAPVATLRTRRTGVRVHGAAGSVADVVVDAVSVVKNRRVVHRFRELEIERLNGDEHRIARLVHVLRKAGAEDHDGRPKLFRALALPSHSDPPPEPDAPVAEHLAFMLGGRVRTLLARDPGTRLGGEIEDLHQMRVATRQLRAILRAARSLLNREWAEALRAELAWLGKLLGPARDLDVQAAYFQAEAATLKSRDRPPLDRFIGQMRRERQTAQKTLLDGLRSPRYLALIAALIRAARKPPVADSDATLEGIAAREYGKLRKSMKRIGRSPTDAELHRVRIRTKRARYAAELARAVRGKPAARFIGQAKEFQDLLGLHQDAVLAEAHVRAFLADARGVRAAFVAGRMVERQRQRREAVRSVLPSQWRKLKRRGRKAWE